MRASAAIVVAVSLASALGSAHAQPATDKLGATELMALGVKLFDEKNYLGALAVFKDAYARFPTPKILLNIGVTLSRLDRKPEAANTYQRYLDSPDADAAKKTEIAGAVAELDKRVGQLEITVTPADAEVQINDEDWVPAANAKLVRVAEGTFRVRARKDKYQAEGKSAQIRAGEKAAVPITLAAIPEEAPKIIEVPVDRGIRAGVEPEGPRSRVGAFALAHLDVPHKGAAGFVGVTFDVIERLQIQGAAILGPNYGGYAGATFSILSGKFRPIVSAGMPIFMSDGARYALRGAGGLELQINRHVSLIAELGVEYLLNPESDIETTVFIPAVGASGRL